MIYLRLLLTYTHMYDRRSDVQVQCRPNGVVKWCKLDFMWYGAVLWIGGRPVAKCDPLLGRAIQHDTRSRPMGDTALDDTENMQI